MDYIIIATLSGKRNTEADGVMHLWNHEKHLCTHWHETHIAALVIAFQQ